MIRARRRALPVLLLAALAVPFSLLLIMPWSAHAQEVLTLRIEDVSASEDAVALEFTVSLAGGASTQAVTVDDATDDDATLAAIIVVTDVSEPLDAKAETPNPASLPHTAVPQFPCGCYWAS